MRLYQDWSDANTTKAFTEALLDPGGRFIGRLGGSDFEAVARVKTPKGLTNLAEMYLRLFDIKRVRSLNGFYDLNRKSLKGNFVEYLNTLDKAYTSLTYSTYAGKELIEHIEGKVSSAKSLGNYADKLTSNLTLYNYGIIEGIYPFFESMQNWAEGKKILVVSPFSESVKLQYARKDELFEGLNLPKFDLLTYTTPITYNNNIDVRAGYLNTRTSNWNLELELMTQEISELDFDVAWLSCGSYAGPLGNSIANRGKKAIYVGGVLNVLFNIYGSRYDNDFVRSFSRANSQIDPIETSSFVKLRGGRQLQSEAMRAYFR